MSFIRNRRPNLDGPVTIGLTTAARPISGFHSIAAPAADQLFTLGNPRKGARVTIAVAMNSTKVVAIRTNSSAQTFLGSTADKITLTTGAKVPVMNFIGLSTSQWAVACASPSTIAAFTLAGSTR